MFPRSGYFFYAAPPVRFARRIDLSRWSIGCSFHSLIFYCYVRQRYKCFFDQMQIFCLFFGYFFVPGK